MIRFPILYITMSPQNILYIYTIRRPNALLSACFYEGACNNTLVTFCYDLIGVAFSGLHILANRNVFFFFFFFFSSSSLRRFGEAG
jgi:hypothetical protein